MVDQTPQQQERRIVFANFSIAVLADCKVNEKEDTITFSFRPTYSMKVRDQIDDKDFDETSGLIFRKYPRALCECKDPSPETQTWFLYCDYHGNKLDITKRINQGLLIRNEYLQKENDALKKQASIGMMDIMHIINFPEENKLKMIEQIGKVKSVLNYNPFKETEVKKK